MAQDGMIGTEDYNGGCEDQDPISHITCATPSAEQYVNNLSSNSYSVMVIVVNG